jgi:acyl-CoA synthetase (AMP-forming)/AMP-acid ligase II
VDDDPSTLPHLVRRAVELFGDRDLVVTLDERVTFREVDAASRRMAAALVTSGVGKGTRVGAQFSYGADWLVVSLAETRIGAIYVPLSTAYKPAELRKVVRHADLALLVTPQALFDQDRRDFLEETFPGLRQQSDGRLRLEVAPFLRSIWIGSRDAGSAAAGPEWGHAVQLRPDTSGAEPAVPEGFLEVLSAEVVPADLAVSIYTSGTTAEPKGVVHSHGALVRKARAQEAAGGRGTDSRVFCGMPFFWVGGLVQGVLGALAGGFTLLCLERPDPEAALDLMEREQATHLIGWPGVTGPILGHPSRAGRSIPALSGQVGRRAGLGMTETLAGYSSSARVTDVPSGQSGDCMGLVNAGVDLRIVDPVTGDPVAAGTSGVIQVRGYPLLVGLHRHEREETFTPDGWYDTGDKGHLFEGLLFFEGRYTEMIKTSGNNVAPPEVESVLASFPEVAEAHVLGVPDEGRGEIVAAAVRPTVGTVIDVEDLRERMRRELSNYKVPRRILILDEVPVLANGKPDRLAIRRLLAGG